MESVATQEKRYLDDFADFMLQLFSTKVICRDKELIAILKSEKVRELKEFEILEYIKKLISESIDENFVDNSKLIKKMSDYVFQYFFDEEDVSSNNLSELILEKYMQGQARRLEDFTEELLPILETELIVEEGLDGVNDVKPKVSIKQQVVDLAVEFSIPPMILGVILSQLSRSQKIDGGNVFIGENLQKLGFVPPPSFIDFYIDDKTNTNANLIYQNGEEDVLTMLANAYELAGDEAFLSRLKIGNVGTEKNDPHLALLKKPYFAEYNLHNPAHLYTHKLNKFIFEEFNFRDIDVKRFDLFGDKKRLGALNIFDPEKQNEGFEKLQGLFAYILRDNKNLIKQLYKEYFGKNLQLSKIEKEHIWHLAKAMADLVKDLLFGDIKMQNREIKAFLMQSDLDSVSKFYALYSTLLRIMLNPDQELEFNQEYKEVVGSYLDSLNIKHFYSEEENENVLLSDLDEFDRGNYIEKKRVIRKMLLQYLNFGNYGLNARKVLLNTAFDFANELKSTSIPLNIYDNDDERLQAVIDTFISGINFRHRFSILKIISDLTRKKTSKEEENLNLINRIFREFVKRYVLCDTRDVNIWQEEIFRICRKGRG